MSSCYKGYKSSNEGTHMDFKHQKHNRTLRIFFEGFRRRGGGTEKFNLSKERDEYEIEQSTTTIKTTNYKKIKKCTNKHKIKI